MLSLTQRSPVRFYIENGENGDEQTQRIQTLCHCLPQWYHVESIFVGREITSPIAPTRTFTLVLMEIEYPLLVDNLIFQELVNTEIIRYKEIAFTTFPDIDSRHVEYMVGSYLVNYFRPWKKPLDYERELAARKEALWQLGTRLYMRDLKEQNFLLLQNHLVKQFPANRLDLSFLSSVSVSHHGMTQSFSTLLMRFPEMKPLHSTLPLHNILSTLQQNQMIDYWEPVCSIESATHVEQTAQWLLLPERPLQRVPPLIPLLV